MSVYVSARVGDSRQKLYSPPYKLQEQPQQEQFWRQLQFQSQRRFCQTFLQHPLQETQSELYEP